MNFKELLLRAKEHDIQALDELYSLYKPLLIKESIVNGVFNEEMYQEFGVIFIICLRKFII